MKGTRLVVGLALAAAIAVVIIALFLPLDGWSRVLAVAVAVAAGACSASLAALLATTMFVKTGDEMWDSGYFRYMRAVWCEYWGGKKELLQINVCKANWLGVVTFVIWFLGVAFLLLPVVSNVLAMTYGIQAMYGGDGDFSDNLLGLISLSLLLPFFSFAIFVFLLPAFQRVGSRGEKNYILTAIVTYGVILASALIAAPIRSVGLTSFLIGVAWFFGVIAAIAAIVGIIVGIWKLAMRISKNLRHRTVPGQLAEMQKAGWKQKACPIIVGKPK